jgi:hypothetical protein
LAEDIYACGDGIFLMSNPNYGQGHPVRAVGWAESDYWAVRAWSLPPFRGDLAIPPAQWKPSPSLTFLGRPENLNFGVLCAFEQAQPNVGKASIVKATYRMTDGAFLYVGVGGNGLTYLFASNKPAPTDEPVAFEIRLPEAS